MKNGNYYVGLDIGTDSVGYAVTDTEYKLNKYKGEPMWGVTLFDEANLAVERRGFRSSRRRLDRRQHRVRLIMELFAKEISAIDEKFFKRIKESYLYSETTENKVRLFHTYEKQKEYLKKYPTIHHLIAELMENSEPHDIRLVYIACAWLVAHRGHFLSEVDKNSIEEVTDFKSVYDSLTSFITHDDYALPWNENVDLDKVQAALKTKVSASKKAKLLTEALFGTSKAPSVINEAYEYRYDLVIKLLSGGKDVKLSELFGKDEYTDLEVKVVSLGLDDDKLEAVMLGIGDDAELIRTLKSVYDWSILVDTLKGQNSISKAKIAVYEQHKADLKDLKYFIKKYKKERYDDVFRSETNKTGYAAYVGKTNSLNSSVRVKKTVNREDFCKYILSILKSVKPQKNDVTKYESIISRLEASDFMPKQVDGDNRVIPYQLYWYELNKILENAKAYIPFLCETDADGITGAEKIMSVFEFRVPYYVGPLKENKSNNKDLNYWMVRKAEGNIYPWNFREMVDFDKSEEAFIKRMTNTCTYLPGEDVLPKNSLVYCAFEVLNEINSIKINGSEIPVEIKQKLYTDVFMQYGKVTPKRIKDYLISIGEMTDSDLLTGIDITVKSSLKPFLQFKNLVNSELLTYGDVEKIINRSTYSEDKRRFSSWLKREYPTLPTAEVKYISGLKFKEFGRLSRKLLCGVEGAVNPTNGEYMSIIRTMWETGCNLMQLLSDKYDFKKNIDVIVKKYYTDHPKSISERLDEMYISNAVKRPIIRTLDILKDIVKVKGTAPERIFIEMARGAAEDQKGKRSVTRLQQIKDLYKQVKDKDVRELQEQLDKWGDTAHNKLQSDKIFLYFMQLGKCLYTGEPISIESVLSGDGKYNIEHIYPRSFVKDDSVINNKILVDSKANGDKDNVYPINPDIQAKMRGDWTYLNKVGLISDEKYKRLIRNTHFTEDEKYEFINRQLVETRQSTKVVASLLKEIYPDTEIVYVKAGLVSDFRQQFDLPKSRTINDLHHAKDAYLNIVVGNVWHSRFSRQFWRADTSYSIKPEAVFNCSVICNGKTVWNGSADKDRVVEIAKKNTAHVTMYSYRKHSGQNGGFFDQNPVKAKEGLVPLKKGLPTEIYGGYDSATVTGFVLVRYRLGKKIEVNFVPLKLLYAKRFAEDPMFAVEYISQELGSKATDIELLLNGRILKIFTMLSLDGFKVCIRGKSSTSQIGLMSVMTFKTSWDFEKYIKKLESFDNKRKKNENIVWDERYDGISKAKNLSLYRHYIEKMSVWPYSKKPGLSTVKEKLEKRVEDFIELDIFDQVNVLLQIQGVFGRIKQADLKGIKESSSSGINQLSLNLSNWKKIYTEVRIIDTSASGLYEKVSENLLDLL